MKLKINNAEWMKDFREFMTEKKEQLDFEEGSVLGYVVFARDNEDDTYLDVVGYFDENDDFQDDWGQITMEDFESDEAIDFETGKGLTPIK